MTFTESILIRNKLLRKNKKKIEKLAGNLAKKINQASKAEENHVERTALADYLFESVAYEFRMGLLYSYSSHMFIGGD